MARLGHQIARNHTARAAVYVVLVLALALAFGLPGELAFAGAFAAAGVMLVGGPAVSRFGFREPRQ